jgi:hypothetical protein
LKSEEGLFIGNFEEKQFIDIRIKIKFTNFGHWLLLLAQIEKVKATSIYR